MLLSTRMDPQSSIPIAQFARGIGVNPADWQSVTLNLSSDAKWSELRIATRNREAAGAVLNVLRTSIEEVRAAPNATRLSGLQRLSAEASGSSVALKYAGGLDELMMLLAQIGKKPSHNHHAHP